MIMVDKDMQVNIKETKSKDLLMGEVSIGKTCVDLLLVYFDVKNQERNSLIQDEINTIKKC